MKIFYLKIIVSIIDLWLVWLSLISLSFNLAKFIQLVYYNLKKHLFISWHDLIAQKVFHIFQRFWFLKQER